MSTTTTIMRCIGAILLIFGAFTFIVVGMNPGNMSQGFGAMLGAGCLLLGLFLLIMAQKQVSSRKTNVLGVIGSAERMSVDEISKLTGIPIPKVREILIAEIGAGNLRGKVEGSDFVKAPPPATPVATVREKETITKVLVVCPYCSGKTEQGLPKCQNCGSNL